jgi:hypothetical protein
MSAISNLQSELDACAEDGTVQEGAYLRLCSLTKEMKQKQDVEQKNLLKSMYVDMVIDAPCVIFNSQNGMSFYDDDIRKMVFEQAKKPGATIFKNWWIDLTWFYLQTVHAIVNSDSGHDYVDIERDIFLELIQEMPNTLENQKHIVDFFLKKKSHFFDIFFVDPDGNYVSDDDEEEWFEFKEVKSYGETVLKICPYLIVLFVKNSESSYLNNYRSFRSTARRHATEELYSDPEFEAALPKIKPKSRKRGRDVASTSSTEKP